MLIDVILKEFLTEEFINRLRQKQRVRLRLRLREK